MNSVMPEAEEHATEHPDGKEQQNSETGHYQDFQDPPPRHPPRLRVKPEPDETERTTRSHEFHCDQNGGGVEFIPQIIF